MRLRNKKTGEIRKAEARDDGLYLYSVETEQWFKYELNLLAEFWEYYVEPKEPLIKDEKIRKAVRVWAGANRGVNEVLYKYDTNTPYCEIVDNKSAAKIRFNFLFIKELNTYEVYTIAELCGEEE